MAQWSRQVEESIRIASVTPQTFCGTPDVSPVMASTHRNPWHPCERKKLEIQGGIDLLIQIRWLSAGTNQETGYRPEAERTSPDSITRKLAYSSQISGESHCCTRIALEFQSNLNECSLYFKQPEAENAERIANFQESNLS